MATKEGGSLLGKADSTLASMSYREAMADVSPDLKSVYQDEVANQALFEKGIKDHFDGLHVKNTKLSDELDELLNTTVGEASNEENQTMYYNTINGLRDRLKNTPSTKEGDLERAKIKSEMSRLKENAASMDNTLIDLQTKVLNKDYNPDATGGPTLEFLKSIAGGKAKKEIIKGRIMYSLPGTDEKISEKDLQSMVASNDPKLNEEFNKVTVSAGDRGKQAGAVWENEREGYVTDYMNSFTTKTGFGNHIHKRQGNLKYTYAQYLSGKGDGTENMKIWNTLKELGVNVPEDKNDDGKITEADFASKENGIALIESLTQINNGSFDFGIAKQAAAEFYVDNEAKREFNDSVALRNKQEGRLGFAEQMKLRSQQLDEAKFSTSQKEKQQTQTDVQNTVYSIENEFSAGDNIVGTGARQAQFMPSKVERDEGGDVVTDAFGQPKMTKSYWSLLDNGVPKGASIYGDYDSPEALDEIIKFVTKTAGKYRNYKINASHVPTKKEYAEFVKKFPELKPNQVIYYQGKGEWLPTKK